MWNIVKGIFTSEGPLKSIENVAMEWIETKKEDAEARALILKTLDPNGRMRREISKRVLALYTYYILVMSVCVFASAFGLGGDSVGKAASDMLSLFTPISTAFGFIVTASFGVNYANVKKGI